MTPPASAPGDRMAALLERLPWSARVLLVLWLAATIVEAALRIPLGGWGLPLAVRILAQSSPFLLASALVIGRPGWPGSRPFLAAAAVAFTLEGLADLALWWRLWGGHAGTVDELNAVWFTAWAVHALAVLLVVAGLWRARAPLSDATRGHPALPWVMALLGLLAAVGAGLSAATATPSATTIVWLGDGLHGLSLAGWAAVPIIALRQPVHNGPPRLLIAAGAAAVVIADGLVGWLLFLVPPQPSSWALATMNWLDALLLLGLLAVACGLGLGLARPATIQGVNLR